MPGDNHHKLRADPLYRDELLAENATKVRPVAESTLAEVKDKMDVG